jgi:hypothetical protein
MGGVMGAIFFVIGLPLIIFGCNKVICPLPESQGGAAMGAIGFILMLMSGIILFVILAFMFIDWCPKWAKEQHRLNEPPSVPNSLSATVVMGQVCEEPTTTVELANPHSPCGRSGCVVCDRQNGIWAQ